MDEIRIAVVGLGRRGALNWIPNIQRAGGFRITALCDPIAALHERALSKVECPERVKTYTAYEDVLADAEVEAIALTARHEHQGALAAQALEAGKHVNAEVPAAHSIEDCWRIVIAQERSGLVYHLGEQTRYAGYVSAWKRIVEEGRLGDITYCEGQYFHYYVGLSFQDPQTGQHFGPGVAEQPGAQPGWMVRMPPIHYLPHDLSPVLKAIDDRVVEVVAMSTDSPSRTHPELPSPDMQVALMKTAKGALMRMAASFAQHHPGDDLHWQQILGTKGMVEWRRSSKDKPKMWLEEWGERGKREMDWGYDPETVLEEARSSGHHGLDLYVHVNFRDAVLGKRNPDMDVYQAMETAAPAILAAESIAQGSRLMKVPDFRPGPGRDKGAMPEGL